MRRSNISIGTDDKTIAIPMNWQSFRRDFTAWAGATAGECDSAAFAAAKEEGRAALMPYMMGGFPDVETSVRIAIAYADNGADVIELGVPFSDPLADGPVIHAAATKALAEQRAIANCQITAGEGRRDFCRIEESKCDGSAK